MRAPERDSGDVGLDPSGREVSNHRCARARYRSRDPTATRRGAVPAAQPLAFGMMVPVVRRILLVSLLTGLVACSSQGSVQPTSMRQGEVVFGGGDRLRVRIAETPAERAAGLMHVMALAPDDGMAFVFGGPVTDRFWMKDTLIPLSVAFVAQDGTIVSMSDMDPCTADPCPTYAASRPYTVAVEANLGWFHDHGVGVGTDARLEPADG
jgi:uncharacterized membrane protein (UPF0127 family)